MIYKLAAVSVMLAVIACTPEQMLRAQSYQERIAAACNVAMTLAPVAGPVAPWILGACGAEMMVAKLALDPSSLAWINELIAKARGQV